MVTCDMAEYTGAKMIVRCRDLDDKTLEGVVSDRQVRARAGKATMILT